MCTTIAFAERLWAETPSQHAYETEDSSSSGRKMSFSEQRIFERASQAARERQIRMENRRWRGISLGRPTVYPSPSAAMDFVYFTPWHHQGPYRYTPRDWVD